ncbi:ParA family protein [Roseomonas mucosa]|uniref:ParA family protein n=1 Tax=Roseomonas mucosa TaxID=207340 RepID=UPI00123C5B87|nr:ParA family protein [Roseomonas mucosa]QDD96835.1 Chromosome partitioning protein parA [Roseomonas mucosa]QET91461.1 ParA family protein [Roseomonas mucosa]
MAKVTGVRKPARGSFRDAPPKNPAPTQPKILVCSSGKGGSGKTCLTRNLAVFAAHAGLRVATIDLDPQRGLTNWYAVRPEEAVAIPNVAVPLSNLQEAMRQAKALGDLELIVVDTPPGVDASPAEMRQLLLLADFVLVPTGQGAGDLRSVVEWMAFIRREQRPSAFVLNLTVRTAGSFDRAKQRLIEAGDLCPFDIRLYESIRVSDEIGLGVAEMKGANGLSDVRGVFTFAMHALGMKVSADA